MTWELDEFLREFWSFSSLINLLFIKNEEKTKYEKKKKKKIEIRIKKKKKSSLEQLKRKFVDVDFLSSQAKKIDWKILVDSSILTKINQRRILSETVSSFFRALKRRRKRFERCYQLSRNHNELKMNEKCMIIYLDSSKKNNKLIQEFRSFSFFLRVSERKKFRKKRVENREFSWQIRNKKYWSFEL